MFSWLDKLAQCADLRLWVRLGSRVRRGFSRFVARFVARPNLNSITDEVDDGVTPERERSPPPPRGGGRQFVNVRKVRPAVAEVREATRCVSPSPLGWRAPPVVTGRQIRIHLGGRIRPERRTVAHPLRLRRRLAARRRGSVGGLPRLEGLITPTNEV